MNKKIIIFIILGVIIIGGAIFIFRGSSGTQDNQNQNSPVSNINSANENINASDNSNTNTNINNNTNQGVSVPSGTSTYSGMVYIKGYDTPSESFGINTTEGFEVGLGKYDSMREQLRPYIGERIKVTFEKICRSISTDCCLSLFFYCGTVKSWEPLEE